MDSKHAAWKHLAADTSTEQDSKLRVENNTAAESKGAVEQTDAQPTLRSGQDRTTDDSEVSDKENAVCNGQLEQDATANVKDREGDVFAAGEPYVADGKQCVNGHLKHEGSGSGEIKAHSQPPLHGKQAAAFL